MAWYEQETHWASPPPAEEVRPLVMQIEEAFADGKPPPLSALCASRHGDDPAEVCRGLGGLDWRTISAHLDRNAAALSFMTAEGVCYYLPAYLRADVKGLLHGWGAVRSGVRAGTVCGAHASAAARRSGGFLRFVRDGNVV